LPEQYRESIAPLWQKYDLFRHTGMKARTGAAKDDISILMFYVSIDQYLKARGKIGFVITQTIFKTEGGGEGFRRFRCGQNGPEVRCIFMDDWSSLKPFEGAANKTSVVIAQRDGKTRYPVGVSYWRKRAARTPLPEDAPLDQIVYEVCRSSQWQGEPIDDARRDSPWITGRGRCLRPVKRIIGQSYYRAREGTNTGGLNGAYWVERLAEHGDALTLVANCGDIGKIKVGCIESAVETTLLHPLLRGKDVGRWSAEPSLQLLLPHDPDAPAKPIPLGDMRSKYPKALAYFSHFRESLLRRKSNVVRGLMASGEFYAMFGVGPYTFAPYKCV